MNISKNTGWLCKRINVTGPDKEYLVQALVKKWADITGANAQSRQNVRRRIRKHGLNSSYAKSLFV